VGELGVLVGLSEPLKIKDRYGKWHTLTTPTLLDISVLEKRHGTAFIKHLSADVIATMLWLGIRKEGRSKEQIEQEDWAYGYSECSDLFSFNEYLETLNVCAEVLYQSGLWDRPVAEPVDPTVALDAQVKAPESCNLAPGAEPQPLLETTAELVSTSSND